MADLRIADAPEIDESEVQGGLKIPTGGFGNKAINMNTVASWVVKDKGLVDKTYVDNAIGGGGQGLNAHIDNKNNPHAVTKAQVGLGNVDNTADADKPISNATSAVLNLKADKTEIDLKADKSTTYTKTEVDGVVDDLYQSLEDNFVANGAALPYDPQVTYNDGAVVVDNGALKKVEGGQLLPAVDAKNVTYENTTLAEALETKIDSNAVYLKSETDVKITELQAQISSAAEGYVFYQTEVELKNSTPTETQTAKALDTKKVWYWDGVSWSDTGLSEYDLSVSYVKSSSLNLFKTLGGAFLQNNMTVHRYLTDGAITNYEEGTYQTSIQNGITIAVTPSGSNATKHYFRTGYASPSFTLDVKINSIRAAGQGEAIGVGFVNGDNFEVYTYSETGNILKLENQSATPLAAGLGGYVVGDIVKFEVSNDSIKIYLNAQLKYTVSVVTGSEIAIGQMGFTGFDAVAFESSDDPIRDYVQEEIAKIPTPDPTVLKQAKQYTETFVTDKSLDLFKQEVTVPYSNDMPVKRFTSATASNDYAAGTYQTVQDNAVKLTVAKSGSSAIKHYFMTNIAAQPCKFEFEVLTVDFSSDAVGIGFIDGADHKIISYSASGNVSLLTNYKTTVLTSGLGVLAIGDKVRFDYADNEISVFVNDVFKSKQSLSATSNFILGQMGFSQYLSTANGQSIDPIRNYVKTEIAEVAKQGLSKGYYSFEVGIAPLLGVFKAYTQVKNDLYVGFEIKHEYDMREEIYQDYWRIFRADFYKFEDGIMQPTGKTALGVGESEFVYRTNSDKVDYTGGYHGDELVTDIKFLADGILIPTTANIALTACEQFEYIEKSTMHETANKTTGVVTEHPKIADHVKHTLISNSGYKVRNKCVWNYTGLMSTLYHGISCIHKDVASTVFIDDTYTDQAMTGSTTEYFKAIGARLYKGRNEANGLAVEAAAYQVTSGDADLNSEFFVHDRSTDSKYYRKTPAGNVAVGEKHESYFECKFFAN